MSAGVSAIISHLGARLPASLRRCARAAPAYRRSAWSQAGVRQKPMRGALGAAVDRVRLLRRQHRAHQRDVLEAAADDAERIEIVALHLDADAAELAKARLVADDAAERRRADRRAAGLRAESRPAPGNRQPRRPSRSTSRPACGPGCADAPSSPRMSGWRIRSSPSCRGYVRRPRGSARRRRRRQRAGCRGRSASRARSACRPCR